MIGGAADDSVSALSGWRVRTLSFGKLSHNVCRFAVWKERLNGFSAA